MLPIFLNDLRQNNQNDDFVQVTLELGDDEIFLRSVTPTPPQEPSTNDGFFSRSLSATSRLRRMFSWRKSTSTRASLDITEDRDHHHQTVSARDIRKMKVKLERTKSSAQQALKGLRFINITTATVDEDELWLRVDSRFDSLCKDGLLSREDFGECIGMVDSKEFALGVFDALARRRRQKIERITKEELYDFWLQISDQSFDARLQLFFDM